MKNELQTLRLFSPLFPHIYRENEWGDYENASEDLDASELLEYEDAILDRIEKEKLPDEGERGLAVYLDDDLSQKVHSINPSVEHPVKQVNSYGEFFLTKDGIDHVNEPVEAPESAELSVPHALLEAAGIPLDDDLDIRCEDGAIIIDNCQDILFGGFAPNSESADILSKALGNKTVMSGSISRGKNDPSQSLQMIQRPLMTPDELKTLPKGNFILAKTGCCPMRTKLPLFLKWGIQFENPFEVEERATRKVHYADRFELEQEILQRGCAYDEDDFAEFPEPPDDDRSGGALHTPVPEYAPEPPAMPLRTD